MTEITYSDEMKQLFEYLRIDDDMRAGEAFILSELLNASHRYIETSTGKQYNENDSVMTMCARLITTHWYTNRNSHNAKNKEYNHAITALLQHIQISDKYPKEVE